MKTFDSLIWLWLLWLYSQPICSLDWVSCYILSFNFFYGFVLVHYALEILPLFHVFYSLLLWPHLHVFYSIDLWPRFQIWFNPVVIGPFPFGFERPSNLPNAIKCTPPPFVFLQRSFLIALLHFAFLLSFKIPHLENGKRIVLRPVHPHSPPSQKVDTERTCYRCFVRTFPC